MNVTFRMAGPEDCPLILKMIRGLADYEKLGHEVVADETTLRRHLFEMGRAQVLFPLVEGQEAGFALFFHNFSTFLGKSGLYLEDLYVLPQFRGRGVGSQTLRELARIALREDCGRLEWACLDWNQPSIDFYLARGARPMTGWTTYRLTGETLRRMAGE